MLVFMPLYSRVLVSETAFFFFALHLPLVLLLPLPWNGLGRCVVSDGWDTLEARSGAPKRALFWYPKVAPFNRR